MTTDIRDEAAAMTLREVADRYAAPCPFKPGDLVTPRTGYNLARPGAPHVVLEVFDKPIRVTSTDAVRESTSAQFGKRIDMRIACHGDGDLLAFCVEAWTFEPWPIRKAEAARDAA